MKTEGTVNERGNTWGVLIKERGKEEDCLMATDPFLVGSIGMAVPIPTNQRQQLTGQGPMGGLARAC